MLIYMYIYLQNCIYIYTYIQNYILYVYFQVYIYIYICIYNVSVYIHIYIQLQIYVFNFLVILCVPIALTSFVSGDHQGRRMMSPLIYSGPCRRTCAMIWGSQSDLTLTKAWNHDSDQGNHPHIASFKFVKMQVVQINLSFSQQLVATCDHPPLNSREWSPENVAENSTNFNPSQ